MGGQEVSVHRHALQLSSDTKTWRENNGISNLLSSIMRPSYIDLYLPFDLDVPILQGEHRANIVVGQHMANFGFSIHLGTIQVVPSCLA